MWWKLLGILAGAIAVGLTISVAVMITKEYLAKTVKEKEPDAFKVKIKELKKNAVDVGIYNKKGEHINDMEITSTKGVSNSLHEGQIIYVV